MTNKPESQSTEETEEQVRERRAKVHAVHTLNNTAIELVLCMRVPEGKLTPESAKVISDRKYVSLADIDSSNAVDIIGLMLDGMTEDVLKALREQIDEFEKERAGDGQPQVEAPVAE